MIDHVNVPVADIDRSLTFYLPVLKVFGMKLLLQEQDVVGFGTENWQIGLVLEPVVTAMHFALAVGDRQLVHDFYKVAIAAGGVDNGKPGLRADYGENYFSAYVIDHNGHNVEAVCRT
jgi:catechol 2,3-dioxygenase-like lactoylglutathione lyase family enzyme